MQRPRSIQHRLPFTGPAIPAEGLKVLDLFAGTGGLSLGFRDAGFSVTGVDVDPISHAVYSENRIGDHILKDLGSEKELREVPIVIGGPPCRPWSAVNLKKRREFHDDHVLLEKFFQHIIEIRPVAFLMENVPPLMNDPEYLRLREETARLGYSIRAEVIRYCDFGAATSRRRLFTFGIHDSSGWSADHFFEQLDGERTAQKRTVADAIEWLRDAPRGCVPDHEWSVLRTIGKYEERYESGQYGWKQLDWRSPAPSFGSIAKTYILHPDSGSADFKPRVLSVREVLSIMGFKPDFRFPPRTALHRRYHMVANAVSPHVARACARVIRGMISVEPASHELQTRAVSL